MPSRVKDVLARDWLHLIGEQGLYRYGAPVGGHELDLVRRAVSVDEDDSPDVAGNQSKSRQVLPQCC